MLEFDRHNSFPIDKGAVGGLEVVQLIIVPISYQNPMPLRHVVIWDANIGLFGASDSYKVVRQIDRSDERTG